MPAPTNISFATATDLGTSLPVSFNQDAHFSGVTYDLYFKRTCQPGEKVLGFSFTSDPYPAANLSVDYSPIANLYNYDGGAFTFVGNAARNCPTQVPAIEGETYYWKIQALPFSPDPNPAILNVEVKKPVLSVIPAGSVIINSASIASSQILAGYTGLPLGFIDVGASGSGLGIVNFIPFFICGEYGDSVDTGRYLYTDGGGSMPPYPPGFNYVNLYDANLDFVTRTAIAETGSGKPKIRSHRPLNQFYVYNSRNGATPGTLRVLDSNAVEQTSYSSLNLNGNAYCISLDGLTCYLAGSGSSTFNEIKPLNLATLTFGANLVARVAGYFVSDMLTLADGTFLVAYFKSSSPRDAYVKRFDTSGTLLNTYGTGFTPLSSGHRLGTASDESGQPHFWLLAHLGSSTVAGYSTISKIRVSDGNITKQQDVFNALSQDQQYPTLQSSTPIVSDTCPIVELLSAVAIGATLTVTKVTDPSGAAVSFDIDVGPGLSPATPSLMDGQSQVYEAIAAGTYSVVEPPVAGWTTTYGVSNGDPPDAIEIADGDDVTVTVTNTLDTPPGCPGETGPARQDGVPYVSPCED